MSLLSHITLPVRTLASAVAFYDAVMSVVGASRTQSSAYASAYAESPSERPFLWLIPNSARPGAVNTRLSLQAKTQDQVRRFHQAAVAANGVSIQTPAAMPQYGGSAFGCVVHDPDGHQLELVVYGESPQRAERPLNEMLDGEAPDYPDY